jgi:DNA modification methylase
MVRLEEAAIREELADRIKASPSDNVKKKLMDSFIVQDCFEGMASIPDGSISIIEIDPPYAINLEKQKKEYSYGETYNEIHTKDYPKFLRQLFSESYRCMAEHSWIIVWFAHEPWFETVYKLLRDTGFQGSRMVGLWRKPTGQNQQPQYNLTNVTEMFFYMRKGAPAIGMPGRNNTFDYPPVPSSAKVHPTERPIELARDLLSTFGFEGQRVLVPCCGSGNTLLAAHGLGMTPLGFDLTKQYKDSYILKVHKM